MEKEASKQKFAIAKSMFIEGQYEQALVLLDELSKEHPAVFNIEFPMLQCFRQLGRLEETKELYELMVHVYKNAKEQEKLARIKEWIAQQEGGDSDGLDDLQVDLNTESMMGLDMMGDLFERSAGKKRISSSSTSHAVASQQRSWTGIILALLVVIAGGGGAAYFILPDVLGAPQFSASVVLGLPFANLEGKFYRKNIDTTRTELMGQIVITKKGKAYRIISESKKYAVADLKDIAGQSPFAEMSDFDTWIKNNSGTKVGEETLYGYICDVYQANVRMSPSVPPADTKIWYARDLQFPVKSETMTAPLLGKVVMFLKDIQAGKQPASLFEPPQDCEKVSMEEIAELSRRMGVGGERPPGTPPPGTGNAPDNSKNLSPNEMKKLMEQFNIQ
jgi:hypothetical protein